MKVVFICSILILFSCSSKEEQPTGVIPDAQLKALEKAQEVENLLKQQDETLRKKIEE